MNSTAPASAKGSRMRAAVSAAGVRPASGVSSAQRPDALLDVGELILALGMLCADILHQRCRSTPTNLLASWAANIPSPFCLRLFLVQAGQPFSRSMSSIIGIKPRAAWVDTCTMPSVLPLVLGGKVHLGSKKQTLPDRPVLPEGGLGSAVSRTMLVFWRGERSSRCAWYAQP